MTAGVFLATGQPYVERFVESGTGAARPRLSLSAWRRRRAMSANELAKAAHVATSTVTAIEDVEDPATPRYATIRKLAQALGVEPADVLWPGDPLGLEGE